VITPTRSDVDDAGVVPPGELLRAIESFDKRAGRPSVAERSAFAAGKRALSAVGDRTAVAIPDLYAWLLEEIENLDARLPGPARNSDSHVRTARNQIRSAVDASTADTTT
jgi:hypothetical protein